MSMIRTAGLALAAVLLVALLPAAGADALTLRGSLPHALALPDSPWWVVVHDQCNDTLRWINPSGEFAAIARPTLPDEAPGAPCSAKALHISQNGRYLVEIAPLNSGRTGIGFYDLQTGTWLMVHQAQPSEYGYLGDRYSSDSTNRIAISFANDPTAPRAWRVILFDMTTGNVLEQLQSSGPEIASFVGGEFLASAATVPHVVLLATNPGDGSSQIHIRFDALDGTTAPLGAAAWYPQGAPGVGQKLISSPYTQADLDLLPDGRAIMAYEDASYPAGPPVGEDAAHLITTNAIGMLLPTSADPSPSPQLFYVDGVTTVYGPRWAADGHIALFRQGDASGTRVQWNTVGTAVLVTLPQQAAQILGVPAGFVYSTADSLYYQAEGAAAPVGPIVSDPAFGSSMALIWASAYGNPLLALDTPHGSTSIVPTLPFATAVPAPTTPPVTGQPDLFVSEFSLNPATPVEGQPVEVRVGVYNQGSSTAATFQIAWWPGENYPSPACTWSLDGLVGTGGRILTCTYAGYPSPYGTINTKVLIDTTNAVPESNEANNGYTQAISVSASAPVGQPDLFVSEFSLNPATPVQGQPVEVRVGVYNQGTAAATGTFQIAWWPGENYPSPACDWSLDGLVASGGRILTCTYAGYPSPYGTINTKVLVDTGNTISESNEGNNGYTQAISVSAPAVPTPVPTSPPAAGQPDLYVSEFSLNPAVPVKGQPVEVRVGVYNQGTAAATGTFQIAWWPGENYPSPACNWSVDGLVARGGRILTCTYAGYPSPYAAINTKVQVDTGNAISESNEGNNIFTQSVRVTSP